MEYYSSPAPFAKPFVEGFTAPSVLSAVAQLFVASEGHNAHKTALPTYIHAGSFSCKTENRLYECTSEL